MKVPLSRFVPWALRTAVGLYGPQSFASTQCPRSGYQYARGSRSYLQQLVGDDLGFDPFNIASPPPPGFPQRIARGRGNGRPSVAGDSTEVRDLVVIDASVPDQVVIRRAATPGSEIVVLDPKSDGLEQFVQILTRHRDLGAIHLFSHAAPGQLVLGNRVVSLATFRMALLEGRRLDQALIDGGDLLLYGCSLAAEPAAQSLLASLARESHSEIAASDDRTGATALGGDWDLEIKTGHIGPGAFFSAAALTDFAAVLIGNTVPSLTGLTPLRINETDAATLIDTDVVFTDPDGYAGATLVVSGLLTEDRVSIRNEGSGAGQIGFDGTNVAFAGTTIGTATGGSGASLTVTFNAQANATAVDALIQNLTYTNSSNEPTAKRVLQIVFTDDQAAQNPQVISFTQETGGANPLDNGAVSTYSNAAIADLDGDGDLDIVSGQNDGTFVYFRNEGTRTSPTFVKYTTDPVNPLNGVDLGSTTEYGAPTFVDIDQDGDFDLFTGYNDGGVRFFRNTGSATSPVFTEETGGSNPLNVVTGPHYSVPAFFDIDGDGDQDVVVGSNTALQLFRNDGTASAPAFSLITGAGNPLNGITGFVYAAPAFGDFDLDGDFDLLLGNTDGTFRFFENTGTAIAPGFTERTASANPLNGVDVGNLARPSFADIDDDGLLDIVSGNSTGAFSYFHNTSTLRVVPVTVNASNDAPTLTATGSTPTFTEGGTAVSLFSAAAASTVESGQTFKGLTLTVINVSDGTAELLGLDGTSVALTNGTTGTSATNSLSYSVAVTGTTATVTVTGGTMNTAAVQTLVDGLTYSNSSANPTTTASRVVTLTGLTDSGGTANSGSDTATLSLAATVTLAAVNNAPTLSGGPFALASTNEDTTSTGTLVSTVLAGLTHGDVDSTASGIAVTATVGLGTWQYSTDGNTWTGFGTVGATTALLLDSATQIRYVPSQVDGETATLTFRAWDQTSGTGSSNGTPSTVDPSTNGGSTAFSSGTASASITVTAINDAPTLTTTGGSTTFTEGGGAVTIDSGLTLSDVDNTTLASATVAITGGFQSAQDVLAFTNVAGMGNIAGSYNSGTGVLTLTSGGATATVAEWQTALRAVTYANNSESPDTAARTISFVANDGTTANSAASKTVSVTAINDAPTDIALTLAAATLNHSAGVNGVVGTLATTDVDDTTFTYAFVSGSGADDNSAFNVSVSTAQANGTVQLRANNPASLTPGVHHVRLQTTDSGSATFEKSFAVTVVDDLAPVVATFITPSAGAYGPGQILEFTATFSEVITVTTTGGTPTLALTLAGTAQNATYVSGSGSTSLVFRYTVQPGDHAASGELLLVSPFALNGGTMKDAAANDATLTFSPPTIAGVLVEARYHSADSNLDWGISLTELTRLIELYNTHNGTTRTGVYHTQTGTEDGFAPGSGTIDSYHSADANQDGAINLTELTRLIELYNTRSGTTRTGTYHRETGTEDGFAPGPNT